MSDLAALLALLEDESAPTVPTLPISFEITPSATLFGQGNWRGWRTWGGGEGTLHQLTLPTYIKNGFTIQCNGILWLGNSESFRLSLTRGTILTEFPNIVDFELVSGGRASTFHSPDPPNQAAGAQSNYDRLTSSAPIAPIMQALTRVRVTLRDA